MLEETQNNLIVLYKKVGRSPELIKIKDSLEEKEKLVDGNILVIPYDDILIICNEKNQKARIKPNIIFDNKTISGDCFVVGDYFENGEFKSLTKEQVIKYFNLFQRKSVDYSHFDENGKFLSRKELQRKKYLERQKQQTINEYIFNSSENQKSEDKKVQTNDLFSSKNIVRKMNIDNITTKSFEQNKEESLKMILVIQKIILNYINKRIIEDEDTNE